MQKIAIEDAAETLSANRNIVAAWAFGSAANGEIRPGADLDLAMLCESKPGFDELDTLRADLQKTLHFYDIDLAVLNNASAVLRFEAVSGRLVYCRDASRCAEFVSLTAREYEDEMALAQRHLHAFIGNR